MPVIDGIAFVQQAMHSPTGKTFPVVKVSSEEDEVRIAAAKKVAS